MPNAYLGRDWLRRHLGASTYPRCVRVVRAALGWWHHGDLNALALLYSTDKWGRHWYTQHYQRVFAPLRRRRLNLLEIGVGGYGDSDWGGQSLRMWKAFFRRGRIVGIDIFDKTRFRERRVDIRQCDQTDAAALRRLSDEYGAFDIIVDDGSHRNEHVIATFQALFPLLRVGGWYAIEDVQTSYWPTWGGGRGRPGTSMEFFKLLVDGLNHSEYPEPDYRPSYYDENVSEIDFFHNLVLIHKSDNREATNVPMMLAQERASLSPGPAPRPAARNAGV